jgi:hypothetical protein
MIPTYMIADTSHVGKSVIAGGSVDISTIGAEGGSRTRTSLRTTEAVFTNISAVKHLTSALVLAHNSLIFLIVLEVRVDEAGH